MKMDSVVSLKACCWSYCHQLLVQNTLEMLSRLCPYWEAFNRCHTCGQMHWRGQSPLQLDQTLSLGWSQCRNSPGCWRTRPKMLGLGNQSRCRVHCLRHTLRSPSRGTSPAGSAHSLYRTQLVAPFLESPRPAQKMWIMVWGMVRKILLSLPSQLEFAITAIVTGNENSGWTAANTGHQESAWHIPTAETLHHYCRLLLELLLFSYWGTTYDS